MIGQTVSHYKILEKLGEGGMGEVYLAEDTSLGRKVAIKFLSSDKAADPESRQRFVHEARTQAMLSHPNIATFHEVGEAENKAFIVMEYIEGQPLSRLTSTEKLSLPEILDLAVQVGEGLSAAHEKGIVHRDIKPENVLVTSKRHAKITDFGLAKWKGASTLTKTGARMGTAYYMSPEQVEGKKVDNRTDIFSFGAVLYELLCARRPFEGETDTAIFYDLLHTQPHPLARYARNIPEKLEQIVLKCLAKKPEERYQSAADLTADLRTVKRRLETGGLEAPPAGTTAFPSIAVLPFVNLSPDPENEYFSDGLTEEVIANLSKIRTLKVISRTSIMRYKNTQKPLKQIAGELGVQYILEGSVRKQGADLRITAQLIEALQDVHLWAEKYGGTTAQVFEIQEKVAEKIVDALRLRLSPSEREGLKKRYTEDPEAYRLYLLGRFHWNKVTNEGLKKAVDYFNQAIEKDPNYALAYAGLAECYGLFAPIFLPPKEAYTKVEAAAKRALEMDGSLAEAYTALAGKKYAYDWDFTGAEKDYKRALELKPNYAVAHRDYSEYLLASGRLEEAILEVQRAEELDPLSLMISLWVGETFNYARQPDRAIEQCKKTLAMDPNYARVRLALYGLLGQGNVRGGGGRMDKELGAFRNGLCRDSGSNKSVRAGRLEGVSIEAG